MTEMPDHRRDERANSSTTRVARALHDSWLVRVILASLPLAGCVIPPSLSVANGDATQNSPPMILSVHSDLQELPQPGPVLFDQGTTSSLVLTLIDTDVEDTLYVRVFVGYDDPVLGALQGAADPTPPRSTCPPAAAKTAQRTVTCPLTGLCETQDIGQTRSMTIVVFDRPVSDTGTPLYQHIDPPGLSTNRFYYLKCQAPSS
jgi:hypothetical protein